METLGSEESPEALPEALGVLPDPPEQPTREKVSAKARIELRHFFILNYSFLIVLSFGLYPSVKELYKVNLGVQ